MALGDQRSWPRLTWLRGLAVLCVLWLGFMIGLAATGVLIFVLDVGMSEAAGRWISVGIGVLTTILYVRWRREVWLAEDRRTPSPVDAS